MSSSGAAGNQLDLQTATGTAQTFWAETVDWSLKLYRFRSQANQRNTMYISGVNGGNGAYAKAGAYDPANDRVDVWGDDIWQLVSVWPGYSYQVGGSDPYNIRSAPPPSNYSGSENCAGIALRYQYAFNCGLNATSGTVSADANTVVAYFNREFAPRSMRIIASATASIATDEYRVAFRVDKTKPTGKERDYHYLIQTNEGWVHMQGAQSAQNFPVLLGFINPDTRDWSLKDTSGNVTHAYDSPTVYFAVKKTASGIWN